MIKRFFKNIGVLALALSLALVLGELLLRLVVPDSPKNYIWPPKLQQIFKPSEGIMPGISGLAYVSFNSLGVRGSEPEKEAIKMMTIGGSTTECLYLDQEEAWPQLLQEKLNENSSTRYWVGNAGKSGLHSGHVRMVMEYMLQDPDFREVETLLVLSGINDLMRFLSDSNRYLYPDYEGMIRLTFSIISYDEVALPFYKETAWYRVLRNSKHRYRSGNIQDEAGETYEGWRSNRRNASRIIPELPDMTTALTKYHDNLEMMADMAARHGQEIIFLTQPTLYHSDMPDSLSRLLWMGGKGNYQNHCCAEYYSPEALDDGIRQFNEVLLEVVQERNLPYIDLTDSFVKGTKTFYDDCHFNESGSRQMADLLHQYFIERNSILAAQ